MTQTTHAAPAAASDPRIDRRIPTASSSMMAWRVHEYGPPDVMKFERIPRPDPGPGEVLVKVKAAGVGPWDGWIRAGKGAQPEPLPLTLGSDLAGEVVAVGPGVSRPLVGEQIYGVTNSRFVGAYAEYAVASAAAILAKNRFWRARRHAKPASTKNFFLAKNRDSESTQRAFGRHR